MSTLEIHEMIPEPSSGASPCSPNLGFTENLNAAKHSISNSLSDVQSLNESSNQAEISIRNRQWLLGEISIILEALTIPDDIIVKLCRRCRATPLKVSEGLQNDAKLLQSYLQTAQDLRSKKIHAAEEAITQTEGFLKNISDVASRYFEDSLKALGKQVSNLNALQATALLPYALLYEICSGYEVERLLQFKKEYATIAKRYYHTQYKMAVDQYQLKGVLPEEPTFLIGDIKSSSSMAKLTERLIGAFVSSSSAPSTSTASVVDPALNTSDAQINLMTVTTSPLVTSIEAVFGVLLDFIKREESFIRRFFFEDPSELMSLLNGIFDKSIQSFTDRLSEKLLTCANIKELLTLLEIFIGIQTGLSPEDHAFSLAMSMVNLLIVRLSLMIDFQVKSITGAKGKESPSTNISTVTRRYANFLVLLAPFLLVMEELSTRIEPLKVAMDAYLVQSAKALPSSRQRSIYLINNYDHLLCYLESLASRTTEPSSLVTRLRGHYDERLNASVNDFVQEEMPPHFPELFNFIKRHDLGDPIADNTLETERVITTLKQDNAMDANLKSLSKTLISSFSDYRTAVFVINVMFGQLLTAYQHFIEIYEGGRQGKMPQNEGCPIPLTIAQVERILRGNHPGSRPQQSINQ